MIRSLKLAIRSNDLREFTALVGQIKEVPWEIEDELILGRRHDFLRVIIDAEKLSQFSKNTLTNMMSVDNELLIKLKED